MLCRNWSFFGLEICFFKLRFSVSVEPEVEWVKAGTFLWVVLMLLKSCKVPMLCWRPRSGMVGLPLVVIGYYFLAFCFIYSSRKLLRDFMATFDSISGETCSLPALYDSDSPERDFWLFSVESFLILSFRLLVWTPGANFCLE